MNPDLDEARAAEAQRILGSDLYREAFDHVEQVLIGQLSLAELADDRARYLRSLLVANRKIRSYLEQVLFTGRLAAEQKNLMERMKEGAKRFLS